ncbi:MAG: hypothetical protein MSH49_09015 [[Eubacterium] saphenum]|nr:hypothetical protein [[Eubacterium] saphenum]
MRETKFHAIAQFRRLDAVEIARERADREAITEVPAGGKPKRFFGFDARKIAKSAQTARRVPREKQAANRGCSHAKQGWYFRQSMGVTAPAQFRRFDAAEIAKASQKPASAKPERGFAEIRVRRRNGSRFHEKTRTIREKAVFPRSRACSAKLPEMFPNVIPIIFHIIFYHK